MKLLSNVIHCDPDIMGGIPVFVGTRVPIRTLLDYLEAGDSLDTFLDHFPSVSCEQAIAVTRRISQKQSYNSPDRRSHLNRQAVTQESGYHVQ